MALGSWRWEATTFGWWWGRNDGFDGTAVVFRRRKRWCVEVKMTCDETTELCHFSEGHVSRIEAQQVAERSAAEAVKLRQLQA
jgi:hypothetical protein